MKELTHEDWMKNTTPRVMWVWNSSYELSSIKNKEVQF